MPEQRQLEVLSETEPNLDRRIRDCIKELDQLLSENKTIETKVEETISNIDELQAEKERAKDKCARCTHPRDCHGEWWNTPDDGCTAAIEHNSCPCTAFVEPTESRW